MTEVEYPDLRREVIVNLSHLADREYQQRVWIRREYPRANYFDDLTLTINILYDSHVLPDPKILTDGMVIWHSEMHALQALAEVLDPMIDEFGSRPDSEYMSDPRWSVVVSAAKEAADTMMENDRRSLRNRNAE